MVNSDIAVNLLASFRNSLVGTNISECQTLARDGARLEIAANSSQNTFLGNTLTPRISGLPQVLADRNLRSNAATFLAKINSWQLSAAHP